MQRNALKASYICSLEIAKAQKSFRSGNFIKNTCLAMLDCYGKEGKSMKDHFQSISLSTHTVIRRVEHIHEYIIDQLRLNIDACKYFSLALDESTDIKDVSQLIIWIKMINKDFEIKEEMLKLASLHGKMQ